MDPPYLPPTGPVTWQAASQKKAAEEAGSKVSYLSQDKEYLTLQLKSLEERVSNAEGRVAKEELATAEARAELARTKEALATASREAAAEYIVPEAHTQCPAARSIPLPSPH